MAARRALVGLVGGGQHAAAILGITRARLGHPHHARGAGQQAHAQTLLELGHRTRDHRRRDAQGARRCGKAA